MTNMNTDLYVFIFCSLTFTGLFQSITRQLCELSELGKRRQAVGSHKQNMIYFHLPITPWMTLLLRSDEPPAEARLAHVKDVLVFASFRTQ